MNHPEVRRRMGEYLQGELGLAQRALFDAHLDACPTCSGELQTLRRTVELLRDLPTPEVPAHLVDRVIARIEDGEGRRRWWDGLAGFWSAVDPSRYLPPLAAAALTSAVVIVGVRDLGWQVPGLRSPAEPARVAAEAEPAPRTPPPPLRSSPTPLLRMDRARASTSADVAPLEGFMIRGPAGASAPAASAAGTAAPSRLEEAPADVLDDPHRFLEEFRRVRAEAQDAWLQRMAARASQPSELEELTRRLREDAGPEGRRLADRVEEVAYPAVR